MAGHSPPVEVICYTGSDVVPVVIGGASTLAGQGDSLGNIGMFWRGAQLTTGRPIVIRNTSIPGSTTAASLLRTIQAIEATRPRYAVWGGFSINDADEETAAGLIRMLGQHLVFLDECRRLSCIPILATFQANTGMSGSQNSNRKSANADMRTLAAAGRCLLIDVAARVSDESAATGAWIDPTYTEDGVHPSSIAHALLAAQDVAPLFSTFA